VLGLAYLKIYTFDYCSLTVIVELFSKF